MSTKLSNTHTNQNEKMDQPSKRRRLAKKSCSNCQKTHSGCDDVRPCYRCKLRGLACADDASGDEGELSQHRLQTPPFPILHTNSESSFSPHNLLSFQTPVDDVPASALVSPLSFPRETPPPPSTPDFSQIDVESYLANELLYYNDLMAPAPVASSEPISPAIQQLSPSVHESTSTPQSAQLDTIDGTSMQQQQLLQQQHSQQQQPLTMYQQLQSQQQLLQQQRQQLQQVQQLRTASQPQFIHQKSSQSPPQQLMNHSSVSFQQQVAPRQVSPHQMPPSGTPQPIETQKISPLSLLMMNVVPAQNGTSPSASVTSNGNGDVLDRIAKIENIISQQNSIISDLVSNYSNPSFEARNSPLNPVSSVEHFKPWKILEHVVCSIVSIRETKTLKLIGCNEAFRQFFKQRIENISQNMDDYTCSRKIDPLYMLLLLNVIRDKGRKFLKTKVLWIMGQEQLPVLMEMSVHFEEGFFWTEHKEVKPPVFDDSFYMDKHFHQATMQIEIPLDNTTQAKQVYDEMSKKRYHMMISQFLSERIDNRLHAESAFSALMKAAN